MNILPWIVAVCRGYSAPAVLIFVAIINAKLARLGKRPRDGRFAALQEYRLKHDPEKWEPVFGKDHAQTNS